MAIDPVSAGMAAITLIGGLLKSKKHYNLYYFEESNDTWQFVMDGHPSQVNPVAKQYQQQGIATAIIRNKDDKFSAEELKPKTPPTGYTKNTIANTTNWILVSVIVGGVGLVYFFIKRKK